MYDIKTHCNFNALDKSVIHCVITVIRMMVYMVTRDGTQKNMAEYYLLYKHFKYVN